MKRNPFQSTQQTHLFSYNKISKTFIAHQLTIQSLIKDLFKKKKSCKKQNKRQTNNIHRDPRCPLTRGSIPAITQ